MKPPAWRKDRTAYPFFTPIQTRYRDELAHINNVAIVEYYDEARWRFAREVFRRAGVPANGRIVAAESRQSYLAEVYHMQGIEIGTGILRIGNSSYDIGQALFVGDACKGICTTTIVYLESDQATPLSASLRAALTDMEIRQPEFA